MRVLTFRLTHLRREVTAAAVVSVCSVGWGGAAGEAGLEAVLRPLDGHMAGGQAALLTQAEVEEEQEGPRH